MSHNGNGRFHIRKHGQQIDDVRRQRFEFQGGLSDDTQGSFGTHHQLLQTVTGCIFVETAAQVDNIAERRHHFKFVDLMPGSTIFYGSVAAGVRSQVSADEATVAAAGVAGVKHTSGFGGFLDFIRSHSGLDDHIHGIGVHFDNPVKPFQRQYNAACDRNGAAGQAGAGAPRNDRDVFPVGQFDNVRDFLRCSRQHHDFRLMGVFAVRRFIARVGFKFVGIIERILFTDNGFQFR